ncbi:MAG: S1C family serine protease [Actinobacteria bacterium]|nr:S1C family serine protease [Actinomycetota bacterium]MCL5446770.1 S1C family serine protease [Actinomycetota bacterium]
MDNDSPDLGWDENASSGNSDKEAAARDLSAAGNTAGREHTRTNHAGDTTPSKDGGEMDKDTLDNGAMLDEGAATGHAWKDGDTGNDAGGDGPYSTVGIEEGYATDTSTEDYDNPAFEDDDEQLGWVPPDDRLWMHPSELHSVNGGIDQLEQVRHLQQARGHTGLYRRRTAIALGVLCASITISAGGFFLATPSSGHAPAIHSIQAVYRPGAPLTAKHMSQLGMGGAYQGSGLVAAPPDLIKIAGKIKPSLVTVIVSQGHSATTRTATGVVATATCMIITSASIAQGGGTFRILTSNGKLYRAKLAGYDPYSGIAVMSVQSKCEPATFDMHTQQAGRLGLSISSSAGQSWHGWNGGGTHGHGVRQPSYTLTTTVSIGMIRDAGQSLRLGNKHWLLDCVIMDTPFPSSSPGTVLMETDGQVAGILAGNTDINGDTVGVYVPASLAVGVAKELYANHAVDHGWLGIAAENSSNAKGVIVAKVLPGSAAQKAGISANNIIVAIDGHQVTTVASLQANLYVLPPNTTVILSILHGNNQGNSTTQVPVSLSQCPVEAQGAVPDTTSSASSGNSPLPATSASSPGPGYSSGPAGNLSGTSMSCQ